MTGRPHILVLGRADPVLSWIWALDARATTSLLIRGRDLAAQTGLAEHQVAVGLADDCAEAAWVDAAVAVDGVRPVTTVAAFNDIVLPYGAAISERLSCPGPRPELVHAVHHKPEFRRRLRVEGVQDVPYRLVGSETEVAQFGTDHGWPVIVKPSRGAGSYGVTRVDGPDGAADGFANARNPNRWTSAEVMVEQFLTGPQYGVESFSENGEHQVLMIERMFIGTGNPMVLGVAAPADLDEQAWSAIATQVGAVLTTLGVQTGPTHCEVLLTPDGPRVIEAHLRFAGDRIPDLLQAVTGVDEFELCARQLLGQRVLPRLRRRLADRSAWRGAAIWYADLPRAGTLAEVTGVAQVRAADGVDEVQVLVSPGQPVQPLATSDDRYAFVRTSAATMSDALAAARDGAARIGFVLA